MWRSDRRESEGERGEVRPAGVLPPSMYIDMMLSVVLATARDCQQRLEFLHHDFGYDFHFHIHHHLPNHLTPLQPSRFFSFCWPAVPTSQRARRASQAQGKIKPPPLCIILRLPYGPVNRRHTRSAQANTNRPPNENAAPPAQSRPTPRTHWPRPAVPGTPRRHLTQRLESPQHRFRITLPPSM